MTLDELRKKAQDVRNLAVSEAKTQYTEVQETIDQRKKTVVAIGVGGIVLLACFAYFVGTNAGRSRAQREFDRIVRDPCGPFGPFGKDIDRT